MGFRFGKARPVKQGWNAREHAIPGWTPGAEMSDRDLLFNLADMDTKIRYAVDRNDAEQIAEYIKIRDALSTEAHRRAELRAAQKLTTGGKVAIAVGFVGTTILGIFIGRSSASAVPAAKTPGKPGPAGKD